MTEEQARQIKILAEAYADAYFEFGSHEGSKDRNGLARECAEAERALDAYLQSLTVPAADPQPRPQTAPAAAPDDPRE